jgi:outer membrane protein assembly factor BamB
MVEPNTSSAPSRRPVRWWPAGLILVLAGLAIVYVRFVKEGSHQERNLRTMFIGVVTVALLLLWIVFLSRLRWKLRLLVFGGIIACFGLIAAMFEIHGVTGDLLPIFKPRWRQGPPPIAPSAATGLATAHVPTGPFSNSFPQFMGPHRNATLRDGPRLARDWTAQPSQKLWRQPIGAAWSGFAISGHRAVTQEQRGNDELVVCYESLTGQVLWSHADAARYFT